MRKNLKILRVSNNLSQIQMAERLGCARSTYQDTESGRRDARWEFWETLQKEFNLSGEEMIQMHKNE